MISNSPVLESLLSPSSYRDLYYLDPTEGLVTACNTSAYWHAFLPCRYSAGHLYRYIRCQIRAQVESADLTGEEREYWYHYIEARPARLLLHHVLQPMHRKDWNWKEVLTKSDWLEEEEDSLNHFAHTTMNALLLSLLKIDRYHHTIWKCPGLFQRLEATRLLHLHASQQLAHKKTRRSFISIQQPNREVVGQELWKWSSMPFQLNNAPDEFSNLQAQDDYHTLAKNLSRSAYTWETSHYFCALSDGGKILGVVFFFPYQEITRSTSIHGLIVHPEHQGKGVGSALLAMVIFHHLSSRIPLQLTLKSAFYAQSFYLQHQFTKLDESDTPLMGLSALKAQALMRKYWHLFQTPVSQAVERRFTRILPIIRRLQALQIAYDPVEAKALIEPLKGHVMLSFFLQQVIDAAESLPGAATAD